MNLFSDYDSAWLDSYQGAVALRLRPSISHRPVTTGPGRYDCAVATNPDWHPLDRKIEEMLAANPALEEELDEMERLHEQGELKLVEHEEVVARLRRLGVPVGDDEQTNPTHLN